MEKNIYLLLSLFLLAPLLHAQQTEEDQTTISALITKYAEARELEDPDVIRGLFTSDADQLVSSGIWRHGLEALVAGMLRSSQNNPGDRSLEVERIRKLSADVAIADARYTIKGTDGRPDRNMWSTFIVLKQDDSWKISAIRNMLPAARN